MEVRRVTAHPEIADDRGKVAFERGPMVFCLEGADNPGGKVLHLVVPDTAEITSGFRPDLLGGVQFLEGTAFPTRRTLTGDAETGEQQRFMAIPYYAWAHRGRFPMAVWVARTPAVARPLPAPTLACLSTLHTSGGKGHEALADQLLPASSHDRSVPYFHWWPKKGSQEWLQYEFPGVRTVSSTSVYWYDDAGTGECRLPAAWRILYRSGEIWKPVENESGHTIGSDRLTRVSFKPVTTSALRLEIELPEGYSSGLYEWVIE
jgi:hypothetical protein